MAPPPPPPPFLIFWIRRCQRWHSLIVATKVHYIMYKQDYVSRVVAREREISAMTSTLLRQQRWRLGDRSSSIVGRYSLRVGRSCSVRRRGYHFGIPGRSHKLSGETLDLMCNFFITKAKKVGFNEKETNDKAPGRSSLYT